MRAYLFMLNQLITPSTPAEFVTIFAENWTMLGAYTMLSFWNFDELVYFLFFLSNSQKVAIKHSARNKLIFLHSQHSLTAIIKSTLPNPIGNSCFCCLKTNLNTLIYRYKCENDNFVTPTHIHLWRPEDIFWIRYIWYRVAFWMPCFHFLSKT